MPSTTRGSQKNSADSSAHGEGGAAEAPPMGPSEDHDGSQTEKNDHATDPLAIDGPFDNGDTDDGNAILESQLAAMSTAPTKALTSSLAPMQAVQARRDAALQERLTLLTAALARGTHPASIVLGQLQESHGGVSAGAAADAPSTPKPRLGNVCFTDKRLSPSSSFNIDGKICQRISTRIDRTTQKFCARRIDLVVSYDEAWVTIAV